MTELTDLSDTDASNTAVTGNSTEGNVANMGGMDNLFQATLGMLSRFRNSNVFRLRDNSDTTKLLAFNLTGITTATTRTLSIPNGSGTILIDRAGSVIQSQLASYGTNTDLSTQIPVDDTKPQSTEGTQILTVTLTPTATTSKFRCVFKGTVAASAGPTNAVAAMFVDAETDARSADTVVITGSGYTDTLTCVLEFTPGVTTSTIVRVRVGPSGGTPIRLNGDSSGRYFGGAMAATLIVEEIAG
jgi:hypothetical protein